MSAMVEVGGCVALCRDNSLRGDRIIAGWAEKSVQDRMFFKKMAPKKKQDGNDSMSYTQ